MRGPHRLLLIAILILGLEVAACTKHTTRPVNHSPIITSLTVSPTDIGPADSALVTCIATDQDADTLVYDWQTDMRLRIRDNPPDLPIKSNTFNNSEMFYPNYHPTHLDTVHVVCGVRDRRGGGAIRAVTFTVHP